MVTTEELKSSLKQISLRRFVEDIMYKKTDNYTAFDNLISAFPEYYSMIDLDFVVALSKKIKEWEFVEILDINELCKKVTEFVNDMFNPKKKLNSKENINIDGILECFDEDQLVEYLSTIHSKFKYLQNPLKKEIAKIIIEVYPDIKKYAIDLISDQYDKNHPLHATWVNAIIKERIEIIILREMDNYNKFLQSGYFKNAAKHNIVKIIFNGYSPKSDDFDKIIDYLLIAFPQNTLTLKKIITIIEQLELIYKNNTSKAKYEIAIDTINRIMIQE